MSEEIKSLIEHLQSYSAPQAKLFADIISSQGLTSKDLSIALLEVIKEGNLELVRDMFKPLLESRKEQIIKLIGELPLPLAFLLYTDVTAELVKFIPESPDAFYYLICMELFAYSKTTKTQMSSLGELGKNCLNFLLKVKK